MIRLIPFIQINTSSTKFYLALFLWIISSANSLSAQLDNRIFGFFPTPFYWTPKTVKLVSDVDTTSASVPTISESHSSAHWIYPPLSNLSDTSEHLLIDTTFIDNVSDSLQVTSIEFDTSIHRIEGSMINSLRNEHLNHPKTQTYANYLTGTHWGMLHYNKDNEYLQKINPGETLFGNMVWAFNTFSVAKEGEEQVLFTLGGLAKVDFGGYETQLRLSPLIQLIVHAKQGILTVGSIPSHTQHLLPEPMIGYDLTFKKPVEYGFQFLKNTKHLVMESWLDWRQHIDTQTFRQEIISFGTRIEYQLFPDQSPKVHALNAKASGYLLLLHKGGEGFRYQLPLANRSTYAGGFTIFSQNRHLSLSNYSSTPKFRLECLAFYQKDFSPRALQPFKEGTAWMVNMGIKLTKTQQIVFTAYKANQFTTPLGAPFYQCVNENNIIYFNPVRKIVSARYIQQIHMISQNFQIESRLEPIYDLDQKHLLYSLGLYLKYSI